jgi:hypothetical protein
MKTYKYRANYPDRITKFEIIKETPKQIVFINLIGHEQKEAKISEWHLWADTFSEAKKKLIDKHQDKINGYQRNIDRFKSYINTVHGLYEL